MAIQGGSGDYIKRIGVLVENLKKKKTFVTMIKFGGHCLKFFSP